MKKNMILSLIIGLSSFSTFAAPVECPKIDSVTATKIEQDSDGISSMVYCSPSASDCKWKGFDPMAEKGSKVAELLNPNGKAVINKGLSHCDYKLESGDQIRLTLTI